MTQHETRRTEQPPNGFEPLTCGLQNPCRDGATDETDSTCEPATSCTAPCTAPKPENPPDLAALIAQLAALPDADKQAIRDALAPSDTDQQPEKS